MGGDTNELVRSQLGPGIQRRHIVLPHMNAVSVHGLGDVHVVIDDKGNMPLPAQGLQLLGFFQKFALIQRLFPKLDHGNAAIQTLLDHVHQRPSVQPVPVGDGIQQQIFGITFHIEHLCIF